MTIEATAFPAVQPAGDTEGRDPGRETAERLVAAIAARDYTGILGTFHRDARLRYLIPAGPGQVAGPADVAATFIDWFGGSDAIHVQDVRVDQIGDRTSMRYRLLVHEDDDWAVVEQQAFADIDPAGLIVAIDLLCSGFRPAGEADGASPVGAHTFDAGTMGCSDGLAAEFRRRISAIPIGDVLVVTARDPAAKEDLPPLARMMGHTVRSIDSWGDGRLTFTMERGR